MSERSSSLKLTGNNCNKSSESILLKNLRFPVMEENEFRDIVCNTELLSLDETKELLNFFSDRSSPVHFMQNVRKYDSSTERRFLYHRGQIWDIFD